MKASEHCCEEASTLSTKQYLPCNQPATKRVFSPRDHAEYRMCDGCAWHNTRNRGMTDIGPYPAFKPAQGRMVGAERTA